jgi:hypothetical protein
MMDAPAFISVVTGLAPVTSLREAQCPPKRDGRDIGVLQDAVLRTAMPGHDIRNIESVVWS